MSTRSIDPWMPRSSHPTVLHSVAGMLTRQVTRERLLRAMVDRVVAEVGAERGTLYLVDAITGELCSLVAHLPEMDEIRLPPGTGVAGHVAETGETVILADVAEDDRFFPGIDERTGYTTRSMIAAPIRDDEGAIRGVLQLLNRRQGRFSAGDGQLLADLADQVAQALELTSMRPCGDRSRGLLLDGPFNNIVGESMGMHELYARIDAAAATDATVLVRGESGTGKTLVARAIHDNGERKDGPFVHVDCTTLPAGLIESELFGHERGAFTGADRKVQGKFELADGGTLFLDEVGDLPLELQGKLLRFLQERRFERLGGRRTLKADVRVVSATNADLEEQLEDGRFRRDLYYRIKVVELEVPALRDRGPRDVRRLAEHFLDHYVRRHRSRVRAISQASIERLEAHRWPGNVRELEHCIESAIVLARSDVIEVEHLSLPPLAEGVAVSEGGYPATMTLEEVERAHIQKVVDGCDGNRTRAAKILGIGRNTLARKLR